MIKLKFPGHATVLVEMDGVHLLTDPVLRDRIMFLYRQSDQVDPRDFKDVDAVLISHLHLDHLDIGSLRILDPTVRLIVPPGAGNLVSRNGFQQVEELPVGEELTIGTLKVKATPAMHPGLRPPFGPLADSLGYIISGDRKIYFAGDTDIFPQMSGLVENLDVALLPIWGWGPNLGSGHMDAYRAAQALKLLKPKVAIPIHWGTFAPFGIRLLNQGLTNELPEAFLQYAAQLAPSVQIEIVPPGESINLTDILDSATRTQ